MKTNLRQAGTSRAQQFDARRIRCNHCRGDGTNHSPGWDRPGAAQDCPVCAGTGTSRLPYDLERNGTACGVDGWYTTRVELETAMRAEHPTLQDLCCETMGYYRNKRTVGVLTTWTNPDFERRYERDQQDTLYPSGYWDGVPGSKPYERG